MSCFFNVAQFVMAAFFLLVVNLSAQDQGQKVAKRHESLDRKAILIELQSIRHRLYRLEQTFEGSDDKPRPADNANSAHKTNAIKKDGLRIFHDVPIGTLTKGSQIPMGNGHHEIGEVPDELEGRNYLQRGGYQGNTSFEILESQTVFVAFYGSDWGGGGNPSGNWLPEIVSKQQLIEQGWEEFGILPVTHSTADHENEKPWIVFKRKCEVGEIFKLRNHKYQAPVLIWG